MVGSSSWHQRSAAVLSICLAWSGCYSGEFDPELDGIYACVSQDECPDGFRCSDAVCQDDRGPALVIQGPEKLQIGGMPPKSEYALPHWRCHASEPRP